MGQPGATGRGRIVVALDSFKGSLDARSACAALSRGLRTSGYEVVECPVADGGEGTMDAVLAAGFRSVPVDVLDAFGAPIRGSYACRGRVALVELAVASGFGPPEGRTPTNAVTASTFGTGQLIAAAVDAGHRTVFVALGGSATTDGGSGLLTALGARLSDAHGTTLPGVPSPLFDVRAADLTPVRHRLAGVELIAASDVDNSLLGATGAAAVYGPQKGADPETVAALDAALARWGRLVDAAAGASFVDIAGAGAAGGAGYALLAVGARRRPGIEVVLEMTGLAERVTGARAVITGEGSLDAQTLHGKAPAGVAALARAHGLPVIAVAGRCSLDARAVADAGFAAVHTLAEIEPDERLSMLHAERLLEQLGGQLTVS